MVWPILISVAVTPRVSAAGDATGHPSTASALSTPNLVTKRIDVPPLYFWYARTAATAGAVRPARLPETCHDAGMDANHNRCIADAKNPKATATEQFGSSQSLRHDGVRHQRLNADPMERNNEEQIDLPEDIMHGAYRRDDD